MANSASDARGSEQDIRKSLIDEGAVDVMVAIGSNFFYTVTFHAPSGSLTAVKQKHHAGTKSCFLDARISSIS